MVIIISAVESLIETEKSYQSYHFPHRETTWHLDHFQRGLQVEMFHPIAIQMTYIIYGCNGRFIVPGFSEI